MPTKSPTEKAPVSDNARIFFGTLVMIAVLCGMFAGVVAFAAAQEKARRDRGLIILSEQLR